MSYSFNIEPAEHFLNWQQDPHSNYLARLVIPEKTDFFAIKVGLVAEMAVYNPFDFFLEPSAEEFPFAYEPRVRKELEPYLETEDVGPRLGQWLASIYRTPMRTIDFLVEINQRLQSEVGYVIRMEAGVQSCEETLALAGDRAGIRRGSWSRFCAISGSRRASSPAI